MATSILMSILLQMVSLMVSRAMALRAWSLPRPLASSKLQQAEGGRGSSDRCVSAESIFLFVS